MMSDYTRYPAPVPPIPADAVVGNITGGIYWATSEEISRVMQENATKMGLLKTLGKLNGEGYQAMKAEYKDVNYFELALIIAWYRSRLNGFGPDATMYL